jgi:hypothetical protein
MDFSAAKNRMEDCLKRMRADLVRYAESDNASQAAVDIRTKNLNTLIDFFNASKKREEDLQNALLEEQMKYNSLHHDTQKLVYFCSLHQVNPNLVFQCDMDELKRLAINGTRFFPPLYSFDQMAFVQTDKGLRAHLPNEPYTHEQINQAMTTKYIFLNQYCR